MQKASDLAPAIGGDLEKAERRHGLRHVDGGRTFAPAQYL
jgi:hypothetical protein